MTAGLQLIVLLAAVAVPPPMTVRAISWLDQTLDLGDGRFAFSKGVYSAFADDGSCNLCLQIRSVEFGDVDGDGKEEALMVVSTNLGGAGTSLDGYVFGIANGRPVLLGKVEGGDRGEGGIESLEVKNRSLVVRRFVSSAADDVCCPSRVRVERWRWVDGRLVNTGSARFVRRARTPWYSSVRHGGR